MFGSSRSKDDSKAGDYTYLWKVRLDTNHDPDDATVTIFHLGEDMKDEGHIIAVKPTLVNGKIHVVYWRKEKQIYYFQHDWISSTVKSIDIEHDVPLQAFAVFGHSSRTFVEPLHS